MPIMINIDMPQSCYECHLSSSYEAVTCRVYICKLKKGKTTRYSMVRPDWCPLQEVKRDKDVK